LTASSLNLHVFNLYPVHVPALHPSLVDNVRVALLITKFSATESGCVCIGASPSARWIDCWACWALLALKINPWQSK